jgi:hypothetical protein
LDYLKNNPPNFYFKLNLLSEYLLKFQYVTEYGNMRKCYQTLKFVYGDRSRAL